MASDRRSARTGELNELAETIGLYVLGEISLGKAAECADVSRWEMQEILNEAGVELRLGPRSEEELQEDIDVALEI